MWKADSKMAPGPPRLLLVTLQRSPLPQGTGLARWTNTILQTGMWLLRQVTEGFCFSVLDSWWKPVTTPHSRITKQPWGEVPVEEPRSPVSTDLWDPVSEPPCKSRYTFRWLRPVVTHNYNCIRPPNWTLPELLTRRIAKNNKGVVTVLSSHQILELFILVVVLLFSTQRSKKQYRELFAWSNFVIVMYRMISEVTLWLRSHIWQWSI